MDNQTRPRATRAARSFPTIALTVLLAGCQSYQRAPVDLTAHAASVAARASMAEPLHAFVDRLAASGFAAPDRFDPSDGLSPAEGEVLALVYNPDLRMARLDAGVALATFETAGLWEDPRFGFDGAEILSSSGPFEYGLTASLTLPVSGRLAVEKDRAGAAYEADLRRIAAAEWSLRAEIRSAWAQWASAHERVGLLNEVAEQVDRITSITDRLEQSGELTRVESRLILAEALAVRTEQAAAQRSSSQARIRLLALMGLPPDSDVRLLAAYPSPEVPPEDDEVRRLIEANPEIAVYRAEYQVAEESLRLEIRRQYPDITVGGGYGREGDDRLLLGVSVPIPLLNANRGGIAEARARRDRARAAAETAFERLTHQLASAHAELDSIRLQRGSTESELMPMLEEQTREVERLADLGEVNTLLLLETVRRGFEARSQLLDLRAAEVAALSELARILGPDASQAPRSPEQTYETTTPSGGASAEESAR
jgi:outer membrane protein TolC